MRTHTARRPDRDILAWRCEQLLAAGFTAELASRAARESRLDLHALIELVERGCAPELAVRILAPLDEPLEVSDDGNGN